MNQRTTGIRRVHNPESPPERQEDLTEPLHRSTPSRRIPNQIPVLRQGEAQVQSPGVEIPRELLFVLVTLFPGMEPQEYLAQPRLVDRVE